MYVYVHYGIYVYIHRFSCYGFIYVLLVYKCFHISIYIYAVFFSVCERENVCKFETFPLLLLSPTGLTSCLFQELL